MDISSNNKVFKLQFTLKDHECKLSEKLQLYEPIMMTGKHNFE